MKLAVVILSGAGDRPIEALGGMTPLESADLAAIASLAEQGRVGGVRTIPPEVVPSGEAAVSSILEVDPAAHSPGPGACLARVLGIDLGPRDLAFRCDLVNLFEGAVVDPTAGRIGGEEAEILFSALDEALGSGGPGTSVRFLPGDRWRGVLVIRDGQAEGVRTRPPGSFLGKRARDRGPVGPGADLIRSLMDRAAEILPKHDINTVRVDLGENPANGIWVWGGGRPGNLPEEPPTGWGTVSAVGVHPSFLGFAAERGVRAVGIAPASRPAGNLEELGRSAVAALAVSDTVVVHLDGAMEHSLLGEVDGKVRYLTGADEWVVKPLAEELGILGGILEEARAEARAEGRILVVASHVASVEKRRVLRDVVPFLVAGGPASAKGARFGGVPFTEAAAAEADLVIEDGTGLLGFARRA
ncbi:MAG: hypothetical protein ABFS86_06805 [Planctomycetota bacterium]